MVWSDDDKGIVTIPRELEEINWYLGPHVPAMELIARYKHSIEFLSAPVDFAQMVNEGKRVLADLSVHTIEHRADCLAAILADPVHAETFRQGLLAAYYDAQAGTPTQFQWVRLPSADPDAFWCEHVIFVAAGIQVVSLVSGRP